MISFGTTYWFALLLAILVASLGVTFTLYYRNKSNSDFTKNQIRLLAVLRFFAFFFIAFLLLSPFVRNLKKFSQQPIIITALDNSASMLAVGDSVAQLSATKKVIDNVIDGLSGEFVVIKYTFGERVESNTNPDFSEKNSDYSDLLETVSNNHFNQNIGALIIAGDGIFNQGRNPLNLLSEIQFPIYTIGLGDTSKITDARIQNVRVNRTAFSGNKFPVEVDVQFSKLKGENLKLSIYSGSEELQSVMLTPPNNNYFYSTEFILEAGTAGLTHYSAVIESADNERNTKNNRFSFVVNILENKQKVLILSEGAHPDIGAIRNTLMQQKTFDVSVFTEEPYPGNLSDYNLLVLNQLPSSGKSASEILEKAQKSRIPILYIVGEQTFLPQLNTLSQGAKIDPLAGGLEEAQSSYNNTYATFKLSESTIELLPQLPPLRAPFANYTLEAEFTPLIYQKLKGIETGKPLIATGKMDGRKIGFIFGEGIWRWRLFDYYQNQSHAQFNELINQLVQYLSLRENEDNFMIDFTPVYSEIENVVLNAQVYNDAFERVAGQEINIRLKNSNNDDFQFTFDVQGSNYRLNAGNLPTGDYTFDAEVEIGKETFTETGSFTVVPVSIENVVTEANHNLLYQLARGSGGEFYLSNQSDKLIDDLKRSNQLTVTSYFQEMINELLNLRWLFFVFLLILSVEWFLRKFWGIY